MTTEEEFENKITDQTHHNRTGNSPDHKNTTTCEMCDQSISESEIVHLEVGNESSHPMCAYCASTFFDKADASDLMDSSDQTIQQPVEKNNSSAPSAVDWKPNEPASTSGITGQLLQIHYLSLSLLWAIHQTNVRIVEQVLDEVDVQQVMIIGMVLATTIAVVMFSTAPP
ncbi:hypothetical protein K0C01_06840 [Salinarchaeum sp. IM2453]|uniref:hypothetical protein n=1 Tax=Salinarchaeum sp. IM2453 TaxID=2862870 RepID=UPI001C83BC92|nr:hypothetical protein [Salinarchaeum sp. IM2453]QZA87537.1 hypothetical protein K0C01_06840 [Salinarchaeum sp. IM2453]